MTAEKIMGYGLCHCGCGERTTLHRDNDATMGYVKGEPRKFINRHNLRLSPVEWLPEDRGYETPCWVWQRGKSHGYGYTGPKPQRLAHIVYWERVNGPVPDGLDLDHLCRVPACVNPDHLEAVTHVENCRRGIKGVLTTHCPQGHPYNAENTWINPRNGWRQCRRCSRDRMRVRAAKERANARV